MDGLGSSHRVSMLRFVSFFHFKMISFLKFNLHLIHILFKHTIQWISVTAYPWGTITTAEPWNAVITSESALSPVAVHPLTPSPRPPGEFPILVVILPDLGFCSQHLPRPRLRPDDLGSAPQPWLAQQDRSEHPLDPTSCSAAWTPGPA